MTYFSLLLRILLIVSISLNGYAAAAMPVGGMQAMHRAHSMAGLPAKGLPAESAAIAAADSTTTEACHEGMTAAPEPSTAVAADSSTHPTGLGYSAGADASHPDDCCGQYRCQCDCSHAVAIVRIGLRLAPVMAGPALALPPEAAAPSGVSSLPIRPPIA